MINLLRKNMYFERVIWVYHYSTLYWHQREPFWVLESWHEKDCYYGRYLIQETSDCWVTCRRCSSSLLSESLRETKEHPLGNNKTWIYFGCLLLLCSRDMEFTVNQIEPTASDLKKKSATSPFEEDVETVTSLRNMKERLEVWTVPSPSNTGLVRQWTALCVWSLTCWWLQAAGFQHHGQQQSKLQIDGNFTLLYMDTAWSTTEHSHWWSW